LYEAGEAGSVLFLAMRRILGTDLKTMIARDGAHGAGLGGRDRVAGGQRALDEAHREGLVHRDVKPGNILVASGRESESAGHVHLSDFGLTKRPNSKSGITGTGQFMGSIDYAAPEQFEGKPLDARTDVYSLGCVAFECLTGTVPFGRDQEAALMYAHLKDRPPKVSERRPGLPGDVDPVVAGRPD